LREDRSLVNRVIEQQSGERGAGETVHPLTVNSGMGQQRLCLGFRDPREWMCRQALNLAPALDWPHARVFPGGETADR